MNIYTYRELQQKYPSKGWLGEPTPKLRYRRFAFVDLNNWDDPFWELPSELDMGDIVMTQSDGITEIKFDTWERFLKLLEKPIDPLVYVYYNKKERQDFSDIRRTGKLDENGDAHTPLDGSWIEDWKYRPAHPLKGADGASTSYVKKEKD